MKRIFSAFMFALIATVTFASVAPKAPAFSHTYALIGGVWVESTGVGCGQTGTACQYTSSLALSSGDFATVASAIGTSSSDRNVVVSTGTTAISSVFLKQ